MRFTAVRFSRRAAVEHGYKDGPWNWFDVPLVLLESDHLFEDFEGLPCGCEYDGAENGFRLGGGE